MARLHEAKKKITVVERERAKLDLTQEQLAEKVLVRHSAVSLWERRDRKRKPSKACMKLLAQLFRIDMAEIVSDYAAKTRSS